jgi:uncharacterized protein (DUF433 family)
VAGEVCGAFEVILAINNNFMTNRIEVNPKIMMGKPVIKGTRITVENILERLAAGELVEEILEVLPRLEREDIFAALQFAAETLKGEKIYPIAA